MRLIDADAIKYNYYMMPETTDPHKIAVSKDKIYNMPSVDAVNVLDVLNIIDLLRYQIWLEDIPSPCACKEYQEHHKAIQRLLAACDEAKSKITEMRSHHYGTD